MSWNSSPVRVTLAVVVLAAAWQALAFWINAPVLFPSLGRVLARGIDLVAHGVLLRHGGASLRNFAIGVVGALVITVPIAAIVRPHHVGYATLRSVVRTLAIMPLIVVVPLAIVYSGVGDATKVVIVFLCTVFPLLNRMLTGSIVQAHPNASRYGHQPVRAMASAELPSMLLKSDISVVTASIRAALPYALGGLFVAEFVGGGEGLGYLLIESTTRFDTAAAFAVCLFIFALSGLILGMLSLIESQSAASEGVS